MVWFQVTLAVLAAVATPILLVIVRHEIRFSRLRALYEFDKLFGVTPAPEEMEAAGDADADAETASKPPPPPPPPPTFEYVRARYTDDIEFPDHFHGDDIRSFNMGNADFRTFIRSLRWWQLKSSRSILLTSLPLTIMVAYGFALMFTGAPDAGPVVALLGLDAPLVVTGAAETPTGAWWLNHNAMVVAQAAFLGAYLFALSVFLRATMTFDISPQTILRVTVYFVTGIVATVLVYLAFPDVPSQLYGAGKAAIEAIRGDDPATEPSPPAPETTTSGVGTSGAYLQRAVLGDPEDATPETTAPSPADRPAPNPETAASDPPTVDDPPGAEKPVSRPWIVIAFLLGFIPDLAVNYMISNVQGALRIKTGDKRLQNANKSTPLEIIDGIDILTRFRLNECNIYEVQNLAVANPVMLFIETPFGIYQVIDWVAQAQLCVAVGPRRFLELQHRSIRTIFDLERAVLSVYATSQVRRFVASILLSAPEENKDDISLNLSDFSGLPPWAAKRGAAAAEEAPADPAAEAAAEAMAEESAPDATDEERAAAATRNRDAFADYTAALFSEKATASDGKTPTIDPEESIKHLVRIMVDDLHVCRVRQVWQQIFSRIDGIPRETWPSDRLWDTERPPQLPAGIKLPSPRAGVFN